MTPNDDYSGRTALLTSKRCILYIYSTNIGTEYFKHGIYPLFFPLQNAVRFIILTYLVPGLFTFYIQGVLKLKNNSGAKRLISPPQSQRSSTQDDITYAVRSFISLETFILIFNDFKVTFTVSVFSLHVDEF